MDAQARLDSGLPAGPVAGHARHAQARAAFLATVRATRAELEALYASTRTDADKLARKAEAFAALRARYIALRDRWGGFRGYDRWFAQDLNNAKLALVSTYNALVPRFQALLASLDGDLAAFHETVARIAREDARARRAALPGCPAAAGPACAGGDGATPPAIEPSSSRGGEVGRALRNAGQLPPATG